MAKFTVTMTFEAPARRGPVRSSGLARMPGSGSVRYLAGDGVIAVTGVVRADTAAEAAQDVCRLVERDQAHHGFGPVRLVSWTATRSVRVFAGLRRDRWRGGPLSWDDDDGWDDGGTAGVREPRRPSPAPGSLSAAAEPPPRRFFA